MKLNIISYQGKAIPNHSEIPLLLDGYIQRMDNKSTGKDVEKLEPSYAASVIFKWKTVWQFFKRLNKEFHYQKFHF